jgi:hypothetical protein
MVTPERDKSLAQINLLSCSKYFDLVNFNGSSMGCLSITQPLPHQPSRLEFYRAPGWDIDFLQSLWIQCGSGLTCPWFKHTEVPELKAVVLSKFSGDLIKQVLDHGFTINILNNTYSVHSRLIKENVEVRVGAEHLEIWYAQKKVDDMPRLHGEC